MERPELVKVVSWAAANGDRSENGDYIYGKRRLREIDRRLRFLSKRMDNAEIVDPAQRGECDQVFFGATVTVCNTRGEEQTYSIVGMDEADPGRGWISWISPLAGALLKAREEMWCRYRRRVAWKSWKSWKFATKCYEADKSGRFWLSWYCSLIFCGDSKISCKSGWLAVWT